MLWIMGWTYDPEKCKHEKCVLIAAPHTSNLDGFLMLFVATLYDFDLKWMVKDKHTKHPLYGWFIRWVGGVGIDRSSANNLVEQIAQEIREAKGPFHLAIPPEGTRKYRDYWKSGFYYIAKEAGVPIVLSYLDYKRKHTGLGPALYPSDDIRADMDILRNYYKDMEGRYKGKFSRIRLRIEDELDAADGKEIPPPRDAQKQLSADKATATEKSEVATPPQDEGETPKT